MTKRIRIDRALMGVLAAAAMISSAHAASVTWDITPGTVGAGDSAITGGAGTWNTANGNWTIDGGTNNIAWVNGNNDTAIFGGTAGTVTLGENVHAGGLRFTASGYTISGAYTLDLLGTGNITNNVATITFADGVTVTNFSAALIIGYQNGTSGKSVTMTNGASWYGGTNYVGNGGPGTAANNAFNVGGGGSASVVSNVALDIGSAGGITTNNTVTVTNATLLVGGNVRIGYANISAPNPANYNKLTVLKDGTVQVTGEIQIGTGNRTHIGNSLVISNGYVSAVGQIAMGGASGSGGSSFLVTDGGKLLTAGGYLANQSHSVQVIGGGAEASTWNLGGGLFTHTGSSTLTVDGKGVAGSAVVTNFILYNKGGSTVVTNGARMFAKAGSGIYDDFRLGFDASDSTLTIVGGTSDSILDGGGGYLKVGEVTGGTISGNKLVVDDGGIVTNVTELHIGRKGNSANYPYAYTNYLIVTNGGKVFTSAASSIGYCGSRGYNFVGNMATVTGTGSLWDLGGAVLTVGFSGGSADYVTNNALIVSNGGVVTNAGLIYVSDGNATDCQFNSITVNNGSIYSVGLNIGDNGSPNNSVSVENGGTWNMGAGNITVGSGAGTNNALTVKAGCVVTNAGTITVASGNTIQLDGGAAEIHGNITLNGTGISAGGALRNISGNNTYGGTITLGAATRINSDAGLLTLDVASGNAITGTQNLTLGGSGNITVADPIATGTGTVTKDGNGTLTLSGVNTYSGVTTVNAGMLLATKAAALPGYNLASRVAVASGATLAVNVDAGGWTSGEIDSLLGATTAAFAAGSKLGIDVATSFTYANDIGATQTDKYLVKSGAGTLTLSGINTYTNTTTVLAGTLALGASGTLDADNNVVLAGGTLSAGNFTNTLGTLNHTASSTIELGSGRLAFANSSALAGTWSGTLTLTNTLGATTLRFGTDDSGLTPAQVASITYLGKSVIINAQGYIVSTASDGTLFMFW